MWLQHDAYIYSPVGCFFQSADYVAIGQKVYFEPDRSLCASNCIGNGTFTGIRFNKDTHSVDTRTCGAVALARRPAAVGTSYAYIDVACCKQDTESSNDQVDEGDNTYFIFRKCIIHGSSLAY